MGIARLSSLVAMIRSARGIRLLIPVTLSLTVMPALAEEVSPAPEFNTETGFWRLMLPSEYQAGPTQVEILVPDSLDAGKKYPVLYILPVGKPGGEFGDGLVEAKKADLANKHGLICVSPSFSIVPWYGNHASDPEIRQEDFILHSLIPYIDKTYPTQANSEGRWLIGFSKSGWGALTLLLRHPNIFGYAAAWDVPFMLNGENSGKDWGPMGMKKVFGTKNQLQQFLPTKLAAENAALLKLRPRLVVGVGAFWKPQVEEFHAFLESGKIPHSYRPDLTLKHRWDTGWFIPIVDDLVKIARTPISNPTQNRPGKPSESAP